MTFYFKAFKGQVDQEATSSYSGERLSSQGTKYSMGCSNPLELANAPNFLQNSELLEFFEIFSSKAE
jgi:hypothetical protein